MSRLPFSPSHTHLVLSKCSARLSGILARCAQDDASARTILAPLHAELHDIVVHAVVTLRPPVPNAGRYRSMLSRAYADGVDPASGALTVESVESINAILRTVIANLNQAQ
jgi:hypothetical protein